MKNGDTIESLLIKSRGVVNYNPSKFYEVKPGRKSPIFINIKNTLGNVALRKAITDRLLSYISPKIDLVCGIESGGSYYASVVAEQLNKPLVLFRRNNKTYAEGGRFVGVISDNREKAVIIDDVLVSGATIEPAVELLKEMGYKVDVMVIFSYGHDDYVKKRLSINVYGITDMSKLFPVALEQKILSLGDVSFLKDFILQQKNSFIDTSLETLNI